MFETGAPHSGQELSLALGQLLAAGSTWLARMPDSAFFSPQGSAWSPAGHIRHLRKSATPLAQALRLPKLVLALRFGRHPGPSRTFEEVRLQYLAALESGGQAGRFAPSPEPPPADPAARRQEIMARWSAATVDVCNQLARWTEPALDRYQLPHPLLGLLTVREMLQFTVYHTAHHLSRVAERAGDGPGPSPGHGSA